MAPPKRTNQSDDRKAKKPRPNSAKPQNAGAGKKPAAAPAAAAAMKPAAEKKKALIQSRVAAAASDDEDGDWDELDAQAAKDFAAVNGGEAEEGEDEPMDEDADKTPAQAARAARDPEAQREARRKQNEDNFKQLRKARDPVFPLVQALKKQWEKLRRIDLPEAERTDLMARMMEAVKGNITDLIFKRDASRIVQCMVKYGNEAQRVAIAGELKGRFVELSRSMYGRFIIQRFLKYTPSLRAPITGEFRGAVATNVKHLISSYVLETIYNDYCNAKERYHMVQEMYHPKFATFKTETPLSQMLEAGELDKKQVLYNLKSVINPVVTKGILGDLTLVQRAALDFIDHASDSDKTELFESLHPELVAILHNKEGAMIAIRALAHATAKDRKTIAKSFKSYVMKIGEEEYGHWVLLQFLSSVDDTKLTEDAVVKEMDMSRLTQSKYFRKVVLFALVGPSTRHFAPVILDQLKAAGKKDPFRRYSEVLAAVSKPLLKAVLAEDPETEAATLLGLLKDPETGTFAIEVVIRAAASDEQRTQLATVIADALVAGERDGTLLRHTKSMIQYHAQWAKNQAKAAAKEGFGEEGHAAIAESTRNAANLVARTILKVGGADLVRALATSEGAFVALALAEPDDADVKAEVRKILKNVLPAIEASEFKGAATLAASLKA
ncbi:Pumilio y domain member 6 [Blastocladiella emersonii ATCC 22665]|nr:Pumilio y domain member 6 [Blastocladiella emersonii ATCC 22665]